jgi:hypothetical protein
MQAAIFIHGQVLCGPTRESLAACMTDADAVSGFYHHDHKRFVSEDRQFYMKDIVLIRHADAEGDKLTGKGIAQIQSSLPRLNSLYRSNLEIISAPFERCEHTAWALATHFSLSAKANDSIREPATDENVSAALDELPDYAMLIVPADFLCLAVGKATGKFPSSVPNMAVIRLLANAAEEIA